ncbi:unnamed protein product [Rhizoctonia solani]|uniref:Smr domain-containing protein n=1 Tax=Rhizoctonia solani TaxID=456999 RepID=A0A8H3EEZ3_9AGAM|nr:unnamed protein product [Rhizoctonia solani]
MAQAHQDPHYQQLRERASKAGDSMSKSFEDAKKAFERGQKAKAKLLSQAGRKYQADMCRLNNEASRWVHEKLNSGDNKDGVDLHGLYVQEAVDRAESAMKTAKKRGDEQLRLIVGRGSHSEGEKARIKPAIEQLLSRRRMDYSTDPRNAGVLIVQF